MGFGVPFLFEGGALCERERLRACAGVTKIRSRGVQHAHSRPSFPLKKKITVERLHLFLLQEKICQICSSKNPPIFLRPPSRVGYLLLFPLSVGSLIEGTRTRSPKPKLTTPSPLITAAARLCCSSSFTLWAPTPAREKNETEQS